MCVVNLRLSRCKNENRFRVLAKMFQVEHYFFFLYILNPNMFSFFFLFKDFFSNIL